MRDNVAKAEKERDSGTDNYRDTTKELMRIPGVGKAIADDLWKLDIRNVGDLKGSDPEELYDKLCDLKGIHVDRCVLYVFRCAVYFTSNDEHETELLKWWNWKD